MTRTAETSDFTSPILLDGAVQNYAWGKSGDKSLVSRYAGLSDASKPFAELWFGTHPKGLTLGCINGVKRPIRDIIAENPREILGESVIARFGEELPFLFKVLSINEALSIQSHPSKSTNPWSGKREMPEAFANNHAGYLHWKDPQNYPDENHKPEIAVALTTLSLLHGFKPIDQLLASLTATPEMIALVGPDRIQKLAEATDKHSQAGTVREIYRAVVDSTLEERSTQMAAFLERLTAGKTSLTWERPHLEKMFAVYGTADLGIPTSLLMNWVQVPPGSAIYMGPNELHAYLEGDIIECMATSDNVVRAGLTPKFQDKEELLAMIDVTPAATTLVAPEPRAGSTISSLYRTPAREFQVLAVRGERNASETFATPAVTLVLCTAGALELKTPSGQLNLQEGQLALIAAQAGEFCLTTLNGAGFVVSVPTT
jgi:mannose-6-phosphate isomerase